MPIRRKAQPADRRSPRAEAFRSRDLMAGLRGQLAPWLNSEGFRRLGETGWKREHPDGQLMVVVQAGQTGWDARTGNSFIVEFEISATPKRSTGFYRERIWRLLSVSERAEAIEIIKSVASTLPAPDQAFVAQFPANLRAAYLRLWKPEFTTDSSDVWFNYYDQDDAEAWAGFLLRTVGPAIDRFISEPTFFGGPRNQTAPGD